MHDTTDSRFVTITEALSDIGQATARDFASLGYGTEVLE